MTDSTFQNILDKNAQKPMQRTTVKRIKASPNEARAQKAIDEIKKVLKS